MVRQHTQHHHHLQTTHMDTRIHHRHHHYRKHTQIRDHISSLRALIDELQNEGEGKEKYLFKLTFGKHKVCVSVRVCAFRYWFRQQTADDTYSHTHTHSYRYTGSYTFQLSSTLTQTLTHTYTHTRRVFAYRLCMICTLNIICF